MEAGEDDEIVVGDVQPAREDVPGVRHFIADGGLRLQVRPGTWTIAITGRRAGALRAVARPVPGGLWKEGEEVWVFEARPAQRLVDVQGVPSIDPAQTNLPAEWRSLPAYVVGASACTPARRG